MGRRFFFNSLEQKRLFVIFTFDGIFPRTLNSVYHKGLHDLEYQSDIYIFTHTHTVYTRVHACNLNNNVVNRDDVFYLWVFFFFFIENGNKRTFDDFHICFRRFKYYLCSSYA